MDGGYSTKQAANAGLVDKRPFESSYLLPRAYVNKFENEVKRRKPVEGAEELDEDSDDAPWEGVEEEVAGDAADGQKVPSPCAKNWKASAAEGKQSTFDIYDITGIFPVACRHGLIEIFAEIVRSGEL